MESKSKRTLAREHAFKFLFRFNLSSFVDERKNIDSEDVKRMLVEFDETYIEQDKEHPHNIVDLEISRYSQKLILGVIESYNQLETTLAPYLKNWKIEKLDRVDLTVLLMGTYEMKSEHDVPASVVINEYVELAKQFGAAESYSFANGVLDQMAKDLRK